jgi:hypothetical protein
MAALGFDPVAGGFDFVFGGVGLGTEFCDDFAVYANLAGQDELFGMTARGDTGVGDDFLETFKHGFQRSEISKLPRRAKGEEILGCVEDYTGGGPRGIGKRWTSGQGELETRIAIEAEEPKQPAQSMDRYGREHLWKVIASTEKRGLCLAPFIHSAPAEMRRRSGRDDSSGKTKSKMAT